MEIYRGPKTDRFKTKQPTDARKPTDYIAQWAAEKGVILNGTIRPNPRRQSELSVVIQEAAVCALFSSLVDKTVADYRRLDKALWKIYDLASERRKMPKNPNTLIQRIHATAREAIWSKTQTEKEGLVTLGLPSEY